VIDLYDIMAAIGLLLIGVGLWLVSPAASLTVVGAILMALAVLGAAGPAKRNRSGG